MKSQKNGDLPLGGEQKSGAKGYQIIKRSAHASEKTQHAEQKTAHGPTKTQHGSTKTQPQSRNALGGEQLQNGTPRSGVDNEWSSTNLRYYPDERERCDGPGGEGEQE